MSSPGPGPAADTRIAGTDGRCRPSTLSCCAVTTGIHALAIFQAGNDMAKKTPVTMYDAAVPDNIPASAQVVAGYIDGSYAWTADDWKKWPDADKVLITVTGSLKANVADVENGAMTADDARNWIVAKQKEHMRGCTIYCSQ